MDNELNRFYFSNEFIRKLYIESIDLLMTFYIDCVVLGDKEMIGNIKNHTSLACEYSLGDVTFRIKVRNREPFGSSIMNAKPGGDFQGPSSQNQWVF